MAGTRVTAFDIEHPEQAETVDIENNYVLIRDGSAYVDSVQVHSNGTHVLVIKGVSKG